MKLALVLLAFGVASAVAVPARADSISSKHSEIMDSAKNMDADSDRHYGFDIDKHWKATDHEDRKEAKDSLTWWKWIDIDEGKNDKTSAPPVSTPSTPVSTPEPATFMMLGMGLIGLVGLKRNLR